MRAHNLPEAEIGSQWLSSSGIGESWRVLAVSFCIEFVVETLLGEIALFVGAPIVESAMRRRAA